MNELQEIMWFDLFTQIAAGTVREFMVVRRRGHPFLFLPANSHAALAALQLYPAQSWKARLAKQFFALAARLDHSVLFGVERCRCTFSASDTFAQFISRLTGFRDDTIPEFAVLAGNPVAPGRRFVFMLFDAKYNPVAIVKAGIENQARALIVHEAALLKSLSAQYGAVPKLRGEFSSPRGAAFAMDFIAGQSPVSDATEKLETIFTSWLDTSSEIALCNLPAWQRLVAAAPGEISPQMLTLGDTKIRPTLMHGDFAPWNVKVSGGNWTVLDWERGEMAGIPAWDWFHYIVQPAVLVRRESAQRALARLKTLLASPEFLRYAKLAGIAGHEHGLFAGYLTYCLRVIRQTEGGELLEALLREVPKAR